MEIEVDNVPWAYAEVMRALNICGQMESSQRGRVRVLPWPLTLTIRKPMERVLFDEKRDANPFFHLMEAIWMFTGQNQVQWLTQFNSKFGMYADSSGKMRDAYGYRWMSHMGVDQIQYAIEELNRAGNTRRAVIAMWDPMTDTNQDEVGYPCNTHIYFRTRGDALDMTVCNRSNDAVWGLCGANAVHMTFLHELIASCTCHILGHYRVFSNNVHIYRNLHNYDTLINTIDPDDRYLSVRPTPLDVHDWWRFHKDCEFFVAGEFTRIRHPFLLNVALPMFEAWQEHKEDTTVTSLSRMPERNDWALAAHDWLLRRPKNQAQNKGLL
jgi:Thymidylate synthase